MPFLGGFQIVDAGWSGANAVFVDFATESTAELFQLYAGRTLIGSTSRPAERRVIGQLFASDIPYPLSVVRVAIADRLTDFGPRLPRWPWNRFRLAWSASSAPADTHHFDVTASPAAGQPVDSNNLVARVPFYGDGDYGFQPSAIDASGIWTFAITARDNALPLGNAGTPAEVAVHALVPPPDVAFDDAGNRFDLSVAAGSLVAEFAY
jgi:hypothetical protein